MSRHTYNIVPSQLQHCPVINTTLSRHNYNIVPSQIQHCPVTTTTLSRHTYHIIMPTTYWVSKKKKRIQFSIFLLPLWPVMACYWLSKTGQSIAVACTHLLQSITRPEASFGTSQFFLHTLYLMCLYHLPFPSSICRRKRVFAIMITTFTAKSTGCFRKNCLQVKFLSAKVYSRTSVVRMFV